MQRIFRLTMAALASLGLALASGAALAQKAETPDAKKTEAPAKADAKKADASKDMKADAKKADAKKADAPKDAKAAKKMEPMDINTASEKELASLKGIGEVRAKAIVKGRPYKGKNELVDKKIIPQGVYDDIKDQVIAKQK